MLHRLMLLDDEANVLGALVRTLRTTFAANDLRIECFSDAHSALLRARHVAFDLVISDYRMPAMNGVAFLQAMRTLQPDAERVILSASRDFEAVQHAINEAQIFRYLCKPWEADELEGVVCAAFAHRHRVLEDRRLADELRLAQRVLSPRDVELRRLEESDPGITKVNWAPDGSVLLDED